MSSRYKYEFSEFLNDTCDAQKLQLQILDSTGVTTTVEGVTVKYPEEETLIDFETDLSAEEETALDGIVAAHDGVPIVENGSGWAESESESGTTSSTWQEKVNLEFNCIAPDSEFKFYWYAEVGSSERDQVINEFRVRLYYSSFSAEQQQLGAGGSGAILMEMAQSFGKKVSEGHWGSLAGWKYFPLQPGNYILAFEYRNNNGKTTYIRNARLHVEEE
jgi:hypothetical protein